VQTSFCVEVLHSPILASLLHGTRPVGISQTLWHGTRNGITELLKMAPPVFGWAAITLGIGPHSSCYYSPPFTSIDVNLAGIVPGCRGGSRSLGRGREVSPSGKASEFLARNGVFW